MSQDKANIVIYINRNLVFQTSIPCACLWLSLSHTHSSPRATNNFPSAEAPWVREADQEIAGTIVKAAGNLQPARIGAGWGEAKEGHNRRMITTNGKVIMLTLGRPLRQRLIRCSLALKLPWQLFLAR